MYMLTPPGVVVWYRTVILAPRKWKQKGQEFKVSLDTVILCI